MHPGEVDGRSSIAAISRLQPLPRNGVSPRIDRVKCPIFAFGPFFPTGFASKCREKTEQSLQQAPDPVAARGRAIDLKLRLALRVAALAAICFLAVAAYALFDSDRLARAKVSRIAEIVAKDISLQQAQAQWYSLSSDRTPDLQRVAAPLMEPGLCVAYQDKTGAFRQGICNGTLSDEVAAPQSYAALYRAIFIPANRFQSRS